MKDILYLKIQKKSNLCCYQGPCFYILNFSNMILCSGTLYCLARLIGLDRLFENINAATKYYILTIVSSRMQTRFRNISTPALPDLYNIVEYRRRKLSAETLLHHKSSIKKHESPSLTLIQITSSRSS